MILSRSIKGGFLLLLSGILLVAGVWAVGIDNLVADLSRFPAWTLLGVFILLGMNLLLVSLRLGKLLKFFGVSIPFSVASKASLQGHFASLFFISFFGQVVGRQAILTRYGTRSITISALTAVERAILFTVSSAMCLVGAFWIFDGKQITSLLGNTTLTPMFGVMFVALVISVWFGRTTFEKNLIVALRLPHNVLQLLTVASITLLAQSLVLGAFVLGGIGLAPDVGVWDLLAAAAVTSFAASLPISVNGWGIREVAAVYAFGVIGVEPSAALAISVLVGLSSTAVVLLAFPYVLTKSPSVRDQICQRGKVLTSLPIEKISAWGLAIAASVLIFFQIHIPLQGGVLNLNLADPFAILALAAVASQIIFARHGPRWSVPHFNAILIVMFLLLLWSFINGYFNIGITQWALAGRLLGWLVLLGYLSVGVLLLSQMGKLGAWRFVETLVSTSVVIILFHSTVRWMASVGWVDAASITANFEGFSGNRNAFAFQLLCCSVLLTAYTGKQKDLLSSIAIGKLVVSRINFVSAVHGVILSGLVFTGSKAGMLTGALLVLFAGIIGFADRRLLVRSAGYGLFVWFLFVVLLPFLYDTLLSFGDTARHPVAVQSILSHAVSNQERWESIVRGLNMWREAPWIGQGLGVFIEMSPQWFNQPTVIHSTPVWVLAEFGIIGAAILTAILIWIVKSVIRDGLTKPANRAVVMLLAVFLTFSLAHEIFYQRIFWLVLGLCLALPYRDKLQSSLSGRHTRP